MDEFLRLPRRWILNVNDVSNTRMILLRVKVIPSFSIFTNKPT